MSEEKQNLVSRFDARMLTILECILGRIRFERARSLILTKLAVPDEGLSDSCLTMVEQYLANGLLELLVRRGGWRSETFLSENGPITGRLWERHPLSARTLVFRQWTFDFLIWITTADPGTIWKNGNPETPAETLLLSESFRTIVGTRLESIWSRWPVFNKEGLVRLFNPHSFAGIKSTPDWVRWMSPQYVWILEASMDQLEAIWLDLERNKQAWSDPERIRSLATAQRQILPEFLRTLESSHRPDLALFLVRAWQKFLIEFRDPSQLARNLFLDSQRLSERRELLESLFTLVDLAGVFARWTTQARNSRIWDQDYCASQWWLQLWESIQGDHLCQRALSLRRQKIPGSNWPQ